MSEDQNHNVEFQLEAGEIHWPHAVIVIALVVGTLGALWIICHAGVAIWNG